MRKKRTNVMYFNRHIQSMPIKLSALTIFLIGIICFLVSCKKEFECKLKDTATQKVEYKYNSKGDLTDCYHVDKKETKAECPAGCDHLAEVCSQYAHRDTSWVDTNDSNIYYLVDACDLLTNARKVEESKMCPKGCSHTKDKCEEYTHETVTVQLRNGKTVKLEACDKWSDTLNVAPDTTLIPINNFTQLKESLNQIEDFAKKNAVKVVIYNPLEVNNNGFSVLTNFKNLIANSNGKIIAEWRGNFICPPENNIILTSAKWEEMGKPVLGINPDNSSKYDIYSYEKSKFTNYLGVLNIVVLPIELEIYNSATLANAATVIEQNRALPENERAQATVTFTGGTFNLNNGGDIQNLTKIMTYFNDSWAYFSTASTGKLAPATDSVHVPSGALLGELNSYNILKPNSIEDGRYFYVVSNFAFVPSSIIVRAPEVNSSELNAAGNIIPSKINVDNNCNVQSLVSLNTNLQGKWSLRIKLAPVADASKPGGVHPLVAVNSAFLQIYNEPGSLYYSDATIPLGLYSADSTVTHVSLGLNLSELNFGTGDRSGEKLTASQALVGDGFYIVPNANIGRRLNIGNMPAECIDNGIKLVHVDFIRHAMKIVNQRPIRVINPAAITSNYCLTADNMTLCYESSIDEQLLLVFGASNFNPYIGLYPGTNNSQSKVSDLPAGKTPYGVGNISTTMGNIRPSYLQRKR